VYCWYANVQADISGKTKVDPAPFSVAAAPVVVDEVVVEVVVETVVETDVVVDNDVVVIVVVFAPPDVAMYAPAPATTITTTTIAAIAVVLIPVLSNFIFISGSASQSIYGSPN